MYFTVNIRCHSELLGAWILGPSLTLSADNSYSFTARSAADILSGFNKFLSLSLQCFDAVGWVAGRASGL